MAGRIKMRAAEKDGGVEIKLLMRHIMETGQRKDAQGNVIPAHHITLMEIAVNGTVKIRSQMGPAVSKDPYVHLFVPGAKKGDMIKISWVDNKGDKEELEEADNKTKEELEKYRKLIEDSNPTEFLIADGEELWKKPAGPKKQSLEKCDLGKGPGVLQGAYAELPRYFKDANRVMDVEARLVYCKETLQGMSAKEATANWSKKGSDHEKLVAFIASKSAGMEINIPMTDEQEKIIYNVGERLFYHRSGPQDFGCVTCHGEAGKRIRLTDLPQLNTVKGAQESMQSWPAYRVSQDSVWTMERRLIDCVRQMRWPEPEYGSDIIIALQSYMMRNANGVALKPGIKR
ncbi:hypothetical protein CHS0354_013130 [Potamilus streckersoni]|uniref:L-cysteine S-thiosulfotransferase subunit SoxA n=1 Tax=Potamilus streckersoni TaxID=2493646 RepID=A0AAE0S7B3_9BIVA|nr:hypothetical protein CHS0354_013130 [Potamilus streckersoni]